MRCVASAQTRCGNAEARTAVFARRPFVIPQGGPTSNDYSGAGHDSALLHAGPWTTRQAACDSALTHRRWAALGHRRRALNAAGLALTITGGSLVAAGAIWRIVGAKK